MKFSPFLRFYAKNRSYNGLPRDKTCYVRDIIKQRYKYSLVTVMYFPPWDMQMILYTWVLEEI